MAAARAALYSAVQAVNDIAASLGVAGGAASLDSGGKLPSAQLPSGLIPAGVMMAYGGATAPTGYLLCYGQAVSRATYSDLFAAIGTAWGAGDGSTTFNVPDMRDRVPVGKGDMGGTAAALLTYTSNATTTAGSAVVTGITSTAGLSVGMQVISANIPTGRTIASIDSATQITLNSGTSVTAGTASTRFAIVDTATLGSTGGAGVHTLTTPQMPSHTHSTNAYNTSAIGAGGTTGILNTYGTGFTTNATGGGQSHPNVQPSATSTYIIKT